MKFLAMIKQQLTEYLSYGSVFKTPPLPFFFLHLLFLCSCQTFNLIVLDYIPIHQYSITCYETVFAFKLSLRLNLIKINSNV